MLSIFSSPCHCGSKKSFSSCCEPYVTGKAKAPTAEALMRARYTGYATGNIDFLENSMAPETREGFNRESCEKWSKESSWKGLRVVATQDGGPDDATGIVNFVAAYSQDGKDYEHHEIGSFRKDGGTWFFVDGTPPKSAPQVKTGPVVGRNDPCHCGSKKKFKKCHGK